MAKLALLLATISLAFFLANASIYRTTVTIDEESNSPYQPFFGKLTGCEEQIRKQDNLEQCQRYMEEKLRSGRQYYNPNPRRSQHLDSCCEQLENLDRQCRCPGLKQAVQQQMRGGELERERLQEIPQVVETLMERCNVEPRRCEIPLPPYRSTWF